MLWALLLSVREQPEAVVKGAQSHEALFFPPTLGFLAAPQLGLWDKTPRLQSQGSQGQRREQREGSSQPVAVTIIGQRCSVALISIGSADDTERCVSTAPWNCRTAHAHLHKDAHWYLWAVFAAVAPG